MFINYEFKSEKIVNTLLLSIYINLIPIIIASQIIPGLRSSIAYTLIVGIIFIIQTILIFYQASRNSLKVSEKTVIVALFLTLLLTITIVVQSISSNGHLDKYDFINIPIRFISFFTFICILSRTCILKRSLLKFFKGIVILGVIASIYNLIININGLMNVFDIRNAYSYNFQSFYLNRNSFAQLLYFSIISNTAVHKENKSKLGIFYFLLLGFNLIATFSRGSLLGTLIFFIIYLSLMYRKKIIEILILVTGIIASFSMIWMNSKLKGFIVETLVRSDVGTTKRAELWNVGFELLNQTSWIFGIGEFSAVNFLNRYGYSNSQFHSFYVETLVTGGISLIIFFIGILLFIAKSILTIQNNDSNMGVLYLSAFFSMLVYSFFESISFFTMGYVGTLYSIFFVAVPMMYSNSFKV